MKNQSLSHFSSSKNYHYEVALPLAIDKNLIYSSKEIFQPGESVFVPLRNKKISGVVLTRQRVKKNHQSRSTKKSFEIKSILSRDEERELIPPARLKWLFWLSEYYQHSLGLVADLSFPPPSPARSKKKQSQKSNKSLPCPSSSLVSSSEKKKLTKEQIECLKRIRQYDENKFLVHLLHGVTGSGKTEIYFHLITSALKEGKRALILVPEITLTPQHIKRFSLRFPGQVACFHSGLSSKKKHEQWQELIRGNKKILIGPRSALFCPLPRLSWIIVDEEHASHFKQEEKLKYHARDSAVYLGKCLNIPVVLASATPSLESWWNAQTGKYVYHSLKERVFNTPLPKVEIVDMRKEKKTKSLNLPFWLSGPLYSALKQSLKNGEQSALFLNRRGESPYVFCRACGQNFTCVNCDISLTQHQESHLLCHYCDYREEKPVLCPGCGQEKLFSFGVGTARLQKELKSLFPRARIVRADRDEVKNHKQWAKMLEQVENREVDIMVGTQMIAKGLDFPHLNLVGLILADQGLNWPDFRAVEKSFQLITQMVGRSGRRKKPGQAILQSFNPNHSVIKALKTGNYEAFMREELKCRKKHGYPPFGKLSLTRVESLSSKKAYQSAQALRDLLKKVKNLQVLGPAPAPYFRLKNKYRYHLLLKSANPAQIKQAGLVIKKLKKSASQISFNRDPVSMF